MRIYEFYIDRFPVTNEQFRQFLAEGGYAPADPTNFLKGWVQPSTACAPWCTERYKASHCLNEGCKGCAFCQDPGIAKGQVAAFASWYPPTSSKAKPVTFVSLSDARAYCTARGKRLPRTWEWQYAAQGGDGRIYPWGDVDDNGPSGVRYPIEVKGQVPPGPEDMILRDTRRAPTPFGASKAAIV